ALKRIADKHGAGIAAIGTRAILDRPAVAGVVVGARLGLSEHTADTARVFDLDLDAQDHATLDPILARARDLMMVIGDCGDEYR
ncbi:MAG: hypothetical protein ACREFB_09655, partial [Stellaceae bacterium]